MNPKPTIAFFGTPEPAVEILNHLKTAGLMPAIIITNPDKPKGKKLELAPSEVKKWALEEGLPILQPEKLDNAFIEELQKNVWDLFIVVAYGKIIPEKILALPKYGSINVHYSFLPKYRGASPVESQILADDKNSGISLILLDKKMDHGPLLAQAPVSIETWPPTTRELRQASNKIAGPLLVKTISDYISGKIIPQEQNHDEATYTKLFTKNDGLLDLNDDPYKNFLKIKAFEGWPSTFFFVEHNSKKIRVTIKDAIFENGILTITRIVPEGKKEMSYEDFKRNLK